VLGTRLPPRSFHRVRLLNLKKDVHAEAQKRGEIQIPAKKGFPIFNLGGFAPSRDEHL
jgi:hypothetical protein